MNFIVSENGGITAIVAGKSFVVPKDHPNYRSAKESLIANDEAAFVRAADIPSAVRDFSAGNVVFENGAFYYHSRVIDNSLTRRILNLMQAGFPFMPMALFLNNLLENPSSRAIKELYRFLQNRDLPITEDGCFLAYKRVRANYTDVHTGKVNNNIGARPSMPRNEVDDNFGVECSEGFHCGSMAYVSTFAATPDNPVVIVKVNPRDVVSVPQDEAATKCRICTYEVVANYTGQLDQPVYSSSGKQFDDDERSSYPGDRSSSSQYFHFHRRWLQQRCSWLSCSSLFPGDE
jgi:hypothetical protein